MSIEDWLIKHWPELTAALVGGGSGILSKKLIDKERNKILKAHGVRIKKLEDKIGETDSEITIIKGDLNSNTLFDKQLREDLKEHREMLDRRLTKLEKGQNQLLNHVINLISKK